MPHELTVQGKTPEGTIEAPLAPRARVCKGKTADEKASRKMDTMPSGTHESALPHLRADTPPHLTHHHDEDFSDDESGSNSSVGNLCP